MDIKQLIDNIKVTIDKWHNANLGYFEYEESNFNVSDINSLIEKLAYHDYCGWHFIEGYQTSNKDFIRFVYDGGLEHNKHRNACMEMIDELFFSIQKNTGTNNSEGFGSIFDRLINDYIKYIHLRDSHDDRYHNLSPQITFLENALIELYQEIISGTRKITIFRKFKSSGY